MTVPDIPVKGSTAWYVWAQGVDAEARKIANKLDSAHATDNLLHSSGQEFGYVENNSGVTQAIPSVYGDVTGLTLVIPAHIRPVWVEAFAVVDMITAPGTGSTTNAFLVLTDELDVNLQAAIVPFEGGAGTSGYASSLVKTRLDPSETQKTIRARTIRGGGALNFLHGSGGGEYRSWITAYYR